jgi:hypothetical protein
MGHPAQAPFKRTLTIPSYIDKLRIAAVGLKHGPDFINRFLNSYPHDFAPSSFFNYESIKA